MEEERETVAGEVVTGHVKRLVYPPTYPVEAERE